VAGAAHLGWRRQIPLSWPLLRAVQDAHDEDDVILDYVHEYVWQWGQDKLPRARSPAWAATVWKREQRGWSVVDSGDQVVRPAGCVFEQVVGNAIEVDGSFLGPAKLHQGSALLGAQSSAETGADFVVRQGLTSLDL